jgi:sirohydrochlorin cobaltochelatase
MTPRRGLILVAHGSRDVRWRAPFERLERELAVEANVRLAYLELSQPDFAAAVQAAVQAGARELRVLPLFMAGGAHIERDLPGLVEAARQAHPSVSIELLPPIGEDPRFVRALRDIVRDALPTVI